MTIRTFQINLMFTSILFFLFISAQSLDNGLSSSPAMGWNSWNLYGCDINEEIIRNAAVAMKSNGLLKLGYEYINIDDCWQGDRDSNGYITANSTKFPNGMKTLADFIHSQGFKFGIYSSAGEYTCGGRPGSLGYEMQDAQIFASWGVDYLKYDNCYNDGLYFERFSAMQNALNATGRPMVYSLCEWGVLSPWEWAGVVGNSYRTTGDISDNWDAMVRVVDDSLYISKHAGPGHWNDLDMLEVGNGGMTVEEYKSHFAVWAVMKSPLLVGTDVSAMKQEIANILKAEEVIQVNRDPLGIAGDVIYRKGPIVILATILEGGSRAVVMWNRHSQDNGPESSFCDRKGVHCIDPPKQFHADVEITVEFTALGLQSNTNATVRDLYERSDLGEFQAKFTAKVPNHGVRILKVVPVTGEPLNLDWRPWLNYALI